MDGNGWNQTKKVRKLTRKHEDDLAENWYLTHNKKWA
jgi:hypothetical protein